MKKIVCASCGLVNLEKFVSYPHCAACGALLTSRAEPAKWRARWRRPVRPLFWMLAVGGGVAALGWAIASVARETRERADKPLLVYAQVARALAPDGTASAIFTLDSAEENPDALFQTVRLRLSRETRRDFAVINLLPRPQLTDTLGSGTYYGWNELPRGTSLRLTLRARRTEKSSALRVRASVIAANHAPFEVRATVDAAGVAGKLNAKIAAPNSTQRAPNVAK